MMLKLPFVLFDVVFNCSYLASSKGEIKISGLTTLGLVLLVVFLVIGSILFLILGLYLIRKGIINDSSILIVLGILISGFWIGLLYWLIIKDSPSLKKQKDLVYKSKQESK